MSRSIIGIDLGGTRTKAGVVTPDGELLGHFSSPTPARAGREALLDQLVQMARQGIELSRQAGTPARGVGIATAGWVDRATGRVIYATDNLLGWTGAPITATVSAAVGLPVAAENDANAFAIAERRFGLGRGIDDFVCLTLGTGLGGGCYVGGRLNRGAHSLANSIGHISIEHEGLPCNCGGRGCLECYANAAALLRYAGEPAFSSAEALIAAAACEPRAREAIRKFAEHLATGILTLVHLLDCRLVIVAGGLASDNPFLFDDLREIAGRRLIGRAYRSVDIRPSELGYFAGVLGAAAVAFDDLPEIS